MSDKKQIDLELHQKMRAMETTKRAESLKDAKVTIITQNSDGKTVDFLKLILKVEDLRRQSPYSDLMIHLRFLVINSNLSDLL